MSNIKKTGDDKIFSREAQISHISELVAAARTGTGGVCLFSGEAGIGKTRLLEEAHTIAGENGCTILKGRCFEEDGIPPLWPWVEILREIAEQEGWDVVRRSIGDAYVSLRSYLPEIARSPDDSSGETGTTNGSGAVFECSFAISKLLRRISGKAPLLLSVDDIQWADDQSLSVLTFIARNLSDLPLMLLATCRIHPGSPPGPEHAAIGDLSRLPYFEQVSLTGLTQTDVGKCVAHVSGRAVYDHARERIHAATGGNPLLVVQLAEALSGGDTDISVAEIEETGFLRGLSSVVGRSLARVSAHTRQVLEIAALIGPEFSLRLFIETGLVESPDIAITAFDEAAAASIVVAVDGRADEFRFYHDLVRRAVVEGIFAGNRMRIHADIAARLEDRWHDDLDRHAGELYYHFLNAGPLVAKSKAAEYAWRAGKSAREAAFFDEAGSYFEEGLALIEEEECPELRARLLADGGLALLSGNSGGYYNAKGAKYLAEAFRWFDAASDSGKIAEAVLHQRIFYIAAYLGDESRECIELCLSNTDPGTLSHQYARALAAYYELCTSKSFEAESAELHAVRRIEEQTDDKTLKNKLIGLLAYYYLEAGRTKDSLGYLLRRKRLISLNPDGNTLDLFHCLLGIANRQLHLEQFAESTATVSRAAAIAEQSGRPDILILSKVEELEVLRYAEINLAREFTLQEEINHLADQLGEQFRHLTADRISRAYCIMYTGPRAEVHSLLDDIGKEISELRTVLNYPIILTQYLLLTGDTRWIDPLETACRGYLSKDSITSRGRLSHLWNTGLAAVYLCRGELEKAKDLYRQIIPHLTDYGYLHVGVIAWKLGLLDDAVDHLTKCLDCPGRLSVWARLKLGAVLIQRDTEGDRSRGIAAITVSQELARRHGLAVIEEQAKNLLAGLGQEKTKPESVAGLSPREVEVLSLLAVGKADKEIAAALYISASTVSNHLRSIFKKTGAENRTEAAIFALKNGLGR